MRKDMDKAADIERRLSRRAVLVASMGAACFLTLWSLDILNRSGLLASSGIFVVMIGWYALAQRRDIMIARREAASHLRGRLATYLTRPDQLNLIEGIVDPLMLIDGEKIVLSANQAARDSFGANLTGQSLAFHIRHPKILEAVDACITDGTQSQFETMLSKGSEQHYAVSVVRISTFSEQLSGLDLDLPDHINVLTFRDQTQSKMSERMRADFVANASHELRTPLSSLIGFIETIRTMGPEEATASHRFLGIMESEANRMVRLIDDLLSLSRIEMDKHVQPDEQVNVQELLEILTSSMGPQASQRQISFQLTIAPSTPLMRGDKDQLHQVLINLASNALKYSSDGGTIDIQVYPVKRIPEVGGDGVCLTVTDHGEGIPADHLPRLTERFYRVDSARSRKMGGTGLGLAIVKHIISRHRGHLNIESTVGEGTSVSIYIPIHKEQADRAAA